MFENGSGELFTSNRVLVLTLCEAKLIVPPSNATITSKTGLVSPRVRTARKAPPNGRITVWTASQIESTQGILSAKNSRAKRAPDKIRIGGSPKIERVE